MGRITLWCRSYAVVTVEPATATLWVDPQKIDDAVLSHLTGVAELKPYSGAVPDIAELLSVRRTTIAGMLALVSPPYVEWLTSVCLHRARELRQWLRRRLPSLCCLTRSRATSRSIVFCTYYGRTKKLHTA